MNYFKGQTKRPNKNEHGITLVALIITIIILIILAVVTINALTHDGLADLAIKSTQDYQKAQSDEMNMLNEIDNMVKETLKNIEDGTVKPKPEEPTPPPDFTGTIELVNNNIGASTDYTTPAGRTYNTQDMTTATNTSGATEYSGAGFQYFQSGDIALTWKLWGVDDENIYLISDKATTKTLTLANYTGYNNGVTLLDNLCNTLYADTENFPETTARNLKIEDIINTKVLKDLTSDNTKNTFANYEKQPYLYNFAYPYIWAEYEQSEANFLTNRSKAYPLTTSSQTTKTLNVKPWGSLWTNISMNQSSFRAIGSDNGATLYNLVMGTGIGSSSNKAYWLSSRYVYPGNSSYCYFGLQRVYSSGVNDYVLYLGSSSPSSYSYSTAVRPLVQIPLSSCEITQNEDGTFHIAPRI